ncbi:unnamed protein product [Aphanomyces euteiches]
MTQLMECHQGAQAELAKVHAEGDWVLIKIEMEKKTLEATIAEINEVKAQIAAIHAAKLQENPIIPSTDLHKHVMNLQHHEERQKGHLCEDLAKISMLRHMVDEARRVRNEALAIETQEIKKAKHWEDMIRTVHGDIQELKARESSIAEEIYQLQLDMDEERVKFFADKKDLMDQLHACNKPNDHVHHDAIFKQRAMRNKESLLKRTETLEQKKDKLDMVLLKSNMPNVQAFIDQYTKQEETKAALCFEIERQSSQNAVLQATIRQLVAEKNKFHDIHTMDGLNPYCEDLRNQARKSRAHAEKLHSEAEILDNTYKKLQGPLHDLYALTHDIELELPPTTPKVVLEHLASTEEKVPRKVLSKIAHECASGNWQESISLTRLLDSRGVFRPKTLHAPTSLPTTTSGTDEGDDDDDDDPIMEPVEIVHSKDIIRELRDRHATLSQASLATSKSRRGLSRMQRPSTFREAKRRMAALGSERELRSESSFKALPLARSDLSDVELLGESKMLQPLKE